MRTAVLKHLKCYILIIISTQFLSCVSYQNLTSTQLDQYYGESIVDASYPEAQEISNDLLAISPNNQKLIRQDKNGNEYILVTTWTANASYYPDEGAYNTQSYPIWVTIAPELLEWHKSAKPKELKNIDLRLKQLLGLPPNVEKKFFVEFWVKPEDLFRPCPDKDITDSSCGLCFPDESDEAHIQWIKNLRNDSYYNCDGDKYPWTQLGYTYDWYPGNKTHKGLSEYVIKPQSDILVKQKHTTTAYLK